MMSAYGVSHTALELRIISKVFKVKLIHVCLAFATRRRHGTQLEGE
jgi:hypothetical protein